MLNLILIIMLIISLFKPDILLAKKLKEKANDEQKVILTKNLRKICAIIVASLGGGYSTYKIYWKLGFCFISCFISNVFYDIIAGN